MEDTRIVYGVKCSWWDSIAKASTTSRYGLPCCPYCGSVLLEVENEAEWFKDVDKYAETSGMSDYREFLIWVRGRCFPSLVRTGN